MKNSEIARTTLDRLRNIGIEVHLDDFGTGFSSLSYLHRYQVDTLKIDRSFINGGLDTLDDPKIVESIIFLARSLGLKTIAEGVETREQLEQLRTLGCTAAQGYFFSRPVEATAASMLIATWREVALPA